MIALDVRTEGNRLIVGGEHVDLQFPIRKFLRVADLVVVMVESPASVELNRNVMAYTELARLAWQIEASPHGTQNNKPFVGISINSSGELIASNWNGVDYRVDMKTGKLTVCAFTK